jgi:hypothetical protein
MEPKMRIELTTYALRVRCSTPELPGHSGTSSGYWSENRLCPRVFGRIWLEKPKNCVVIIFKLHNTKLAPFDC